jgi:hypothetical protein
VLRQGHRALLAGVDVALPRTGVPTQTFSEAHELAPPRMVLTTRAVAWATGALSYDDTNVSALARHLGVDLACGLGRDRGGGEGPYH